MYATQCERPSWWFVPDEDPRQDAIEALSESPYFSDEVFYGVAGHAYTWQFFLGGGGDWDGLVGDAEINTRSTRYSLGDGELYSRLSTEELVVLLMNGSDKQTLAAKAALRDKLQSSSEFQKYIEERAEATLEEAHEF